MRKKVRAIRHDVDYEPRIACRHHAEQRRAGRRLDGQLEDALLILAEPELPRRAEHAVGDFPANAAALDLHPVRQYCAGRREGVEPTSLHVRRAADDVEQRASAGVDFRHPEVIGVRMARRLDDACDDDRREIGP